MARFRLWLIWIIDGRAAFKVQHAELERQAREIAALKAETATLGNTLAAVISELNQIRNAQSETLQLQATGTGPAVRRVANWRGFVAAAERRPQTIPIEKRN